MIGVKARRPVNDLLKEWQLVPEGTIFRDIDHQ